MFDQGNKLGKKFQPGKSGNPNGRPAIANEVRRWARADLAMFYEKVKAAAAEGEGWAVKLGFQLAGVPMTEDKTPDAPEQEPVAGKALGEMSEAELMAAASKGEA